MIRLRFVSVDFSCRLNKIVRPHFNYFPLGAHTSIESSLGYMTPSRFLTRLSQQSVWQSGETRAPQKRLTFADGRLRLLLTRKW